jgi:hypothetical protein
MEFKHWRDCDDPEWMLVWLQEQGHDPSQRKERLLAVACCRAIRDLLPEPQRQAVEVAERIAEGEQVPLPEELLDSVEEGEGYEMWGPIAEECTRAVAATFIDFRLHRVVAGCAAARAWANLLVRFPEHTQYPYQLQQLNHEGPRLLGEGIGREYYAAFDRHRKELCPLVEEVFGHLFHDVALDPTWLVGNPHVLRLATSIYESSDFTLAPILADALEDAGCTQATLLGHLRDPDLRHVRGCWAIDLLLGKE